MRAVVWEMVLGTTIGTWPMLCVSISSAGNGFMPLVWETLIPPKVRVGGSHGVELAVIPEPSL